MNCKFCGSAPLIGMTGVFKCGSLTGDDGVAYHTRFCNYVADFRKPLDARIETLETLCEELAECTKQIGYVSVEEMRWFDRAKNAVAAWKSYKEAKR